MVNLCGNNANIPLQGTYVIFLCLEYQMKFIHNNCYDIGGRGFHYWETQSSAFFERYAHQFSETGRIKIHLLNGKWVCVGCLGWDQYPWLCVEGEYCDNPLDALNSFEHKLSYYHCVCGIK